MVSTRSKRWNGKLDSIPIDYLKGVAEKMADYGDRVQFSLVSGGSQPYYHVINSLDKRMSFDKNHHLWRPEGDELADANASAIFTLDQVNAVIAGVKSSAGAASRTVRAARTSSSTPRTSAAKLEDQFAAQRYEYFKNNRQTLPPAITQHTEEITELMRQGKTAEEAFGEIVKKYF